MRKERWTDGRTDMTKLTVAFRKFAKAPKTSIWIVEFPYFVMSVRARALFGKCEDHEMLKYCTVQIMKVIQMIFRKLVPPSSEWKSRDFSVTLVLTIVDSQGRL